MTIGVKDYYDTVKADRKKEVRYIAVINKNSCTSCESCATMCPVDCIYEVPSTVPSASYHQIDTSRCIGCQLCFRIPTQSTQHYTLTICPWNAIDMLENPNVKLGDPVLWPYFQGENEEDVPWGKLEELGYQLYLNEEIRVHPDSQAIIDALKYFQNEDWSWGDGNFRAIGDSREEGAMLVYDTTEHGLAMFRTIFEDYPKMFLD